jgi:hypothetical protein
MKAPQPAAHIEFEDYHTCFSLAFLEKEEQIKKLNKHICKPYKLSSSQLVPPEISAVEHDHEQTAVQTFSIPAIYICHTDEPTTSGAIFSF